MSGTLRNKLNIPYHLVLPVLFSGKKNVTVTYATKVKNLESGFKSHN
jgi:hypothetical protein